MSPDSCNPLLSSAVLGGNVINLFRCTWVRSELFAQFSPRLSHCGRRIFCISITQPLRKLLWLTSCIFYQKCQLIACGDIDLSSHILEGGSRGVVVFWVVVKSFGFVSNELPSGQKLNKTLHTISWFRGKSNLNPVERRCFRIQYFVRDGYFLPCGLSLVPRCVEGCGEVFHIGWSSPRLKSWSWPFINLDLR